MVSRSDTQVFFTVVGSHLQREREWWKHVGDVVGPSRKDDLSADLKVVQVGELNPTESSSTTPHIKQITSTLLSSIN